MWFLPAIILLMLALIFLTGCALFVSDLPPESSFRSVHGVVLRGSFTRQNVEALDNLLAVFPIQVIKSIRSVSIVEREGYFASDNAAFCWHTRDICVKPGYLSSYVIWHEAGHAYNFYLRSTGSRFDIEWGILSKGTYTTKTHYQADPAYPKDGILSGYGSRNQLEDVAVYIEAVYGRLYFPEQYYRMLFDRASATRDARFKAKIELIRKYGFISEKDYQKFRGIVQLDSWK